MKGLYKTEQILKIEEKTKQEAGIPEMVLMERAALQVADLICADMKGQREFSVYAAVATMEETAWLWQGFCMSGDGRFPIPLWEIRRK